MAKIIEYDSSEETSLESNPIVEYSSPTEETRTEKSFSLGKELHLIGKRRVYDHFSGQGLSCLSLGKGVYLVIA